MDSDFLSGQIDVLRIAVIALCLQSADKTQFLRLFRDLHQHLQEDLLAHPISDQQLDGIACEARSFEALLLKA